MKPRSPSPAITDSAALYSTDSETPLGWVRITVTDRGLRSVRVFDDAPEERLQDSHPHIQACAQQLAEYFRGERQTFALPLDAGGTPFQQRVWEALCAIPYGETTSYGALARQLDSPGAARAVGAANGQNTIWIIVPCHRVIGASGSLTGYAGGLSRKQQLLELEKLHCGRSLFAGVE